MRDITTNAINEQQSTHERRLQYRVSSRALVLMLFFTMMGLLLGDVIVGFMIGVLIVTWWLITKFVQETNYMFNNRRG